VYVLAQNQPLDGQVDLMGERTVVRHELARVYLALRTHARVELSRAALAVWRNLW
jgi:hypothetical protein